MKLRIKGDSIRLRLSPEEIDRLRKSGQIEETVHFGPESEFVYMLQLTENIVDLAAYFDGKSLTVQMPVAWIDLWAETDRIGFESTQPVNDSKNLAVLVEKDFHYLKK